MKDKDIVALVEDCVRKFGDIEIELVKEHIGFLDEQLREVREVIKKLDRKTGAIIVKCYNCGNVPSQNYNTKRGYYYYQCDCGQHSPFGESTNEAINLWNTQNTMRD